MRKTHDSIGRPIWVGVIVTVATMVVWATGLSGVPGDVKTWIDWAAWALTTTTGKALCTAVALLVLLWYWWLWPWIVRKSRRSAIAALCDRLDAVAKSCGQSVSGAFPHVAMAAGAIILKLRDHGAFVNDPTTEELIGVAMRGQLLVQAGCDNPKDPAAQGEYQVYWIAREAASRRIGQTGLVLPSAEAFVSGCRYITDDIRRAWGITPPAHIASAAVSC